jgi:SAM-dependent methyltransferase
VDRDEVLNIYDEWYADTYDERFHGGDAWNANLAAYKLEIVGELLPPGGTWLDVGCGTGKHLSAYPDVEREGLDLSPSMVAKAKEANPGVPIHLGSYLDDHPEWVGRWDLVTNLWLSYQFVDSLKLVEQAVANMASWVAPTGSLFMHVADCEDVARGTLLPWEDPETPVFGDSLFVTSVTWTWKESNGRTHYDLVAPQLQRMVNIVARHFEVVEVRRWPAIDLVSGRPKGVVGRKKREQPLTAAEVGNRYPYTVLFPPRDHPGENDPSRPGDPGYGEPSAPPPDPTGEVLNDLQNQLAESRGEVAQVRGEVAQVRGELAQVQGELSALVGAVRGDISELATALLPPAGVEQYDTLGVVHEQVWALRRDVEELMKAVADSPDPDPPAPPPDSLGVVPTKQLAAEVSRRLNPFSRPFWRRVKRSAGGPH